MRPALLLPLLLPSLLDATSLAAQAPDSAAFIIRLGTDTTAVERYVRTAELLTAEAVQRSPNTLVHRLQLRLAPDGRIWSGEYEVRAPGATEPLSSRTFQYPAGTGDSVIIQLNQGGTTRRVAVAGGAAIPVIGPFYLPYELALQRLVRAGQDTATVPLLTGTSLGATRIQRTAGDTLAITNQFNEPMRAWVDASGRLMGLQTPAYVSVERTRWLDLPSMAREFAARDAAGRGLGALSPRATLRTRAGEANVWLDYSRPGKRGRPVWGALVPYGEVWRLGANDAAHLSTDRTLQLGSLTVPPGTYTLFLQPAADAWTLIVNRRTGIGGLDYSQSADLGRVPMTVETLTQTVEQLTIGIAQNQGAPRLEISWGDRRGYVPVRVQ